MKHITIFRAMPLLSLMVLLAACSQDTDLSVVDASKDMQAIKVRFNVAKTAFDSQETTRSGGSGTGWENGETIYLRFDEGAVKGTAVFNAALNDWEVKVNGDLSRDVSGKVEAYYFDKPASATASTVNMDATTGVYHATDGSYKSYANGDMDIVVTLKPITGRIRFEGNSGLDVEVSGLKYYTGYDVINHQLTSSTSDISATVASDGYTPYYYCEFADANRQLMVWNKKEHVEYEKKFSPSVLNVGESGYVTIPTEDSSVGWSNTSEMEFTVTGNGETITFRMKKVKNGTFKMGSKVGYSDELPVHSVTLSKDYYIGETEVTQGLWYAVMGYKPTYSGSKWSSEYGLGNNYPAYYISYEFCGYFLSKLNQITGQNFRLPTEAEWEFAAKGGNKSKGYMYAGGNTLGDVGWNMFYSGIGSVEVKTKAANELGLYDMSGNVEEWCYDWYGSYPSVAQTDPAGDATGSERVLRGGGWNNLPEECRITTRSSNTPSHMFFTFGFRLAL